MNEKIVLYSTLPEVGGGATICIKLAEQLLKRGYKVVVLAREQRQDCCSTIFMDNVTLLKEIGAKVVVLGGATGGLSVRIIVTIVRNWGVLEGGRLFAIGMGLSSIVIALISGCRGSLYYYINHDEKSMQFKRNVVFALFFDNIGVITPLSLEKGKKLMGGFGRIVWIPQFSEFVITPTVHAKVKDAERLRLGFLGFLSEGKGVAWLLRKYREWPDAISLALAGDGPLRAEVLNHEKNDGEGRLSYCGKFGGRDRQLFLNNFFENIDVLLVPSVVDGEGIPTVILEALNAGVPVITSNLGGTRCFNLEWLRPDREIVIVVPIEYFFEKIEEFRKHSLRDREVSEICKSYYRRWFSDGAVWRRWEGILGAKNNVC